MTEGTQERRGANKTDSRFRRAFLVIVASAFMFGGPYLAYILIRLLKLDDLIAIASGFVLFMIGLILIWYLIKKEVIT